MKQQSTIPGKIDTCANIATIGAAVLLSAALVKVYFVPTFRAIPQPAGVAVGTSLKGRLAGIDFSRDAHTLVLAISTHCHFCTESAPFFRRLHDEVGNDIKIVAVLPEAVADAKQYLQSEGVHVDQVSQASLSSVGIRGTPTMLLISRTGIVTNVWSGRLEPQEQEVVLNTLRHTASLRPSISPLAKILKKVDHE